MRDNLVQMMLVLLLDVDRKLFVVRLEWYFAGPEPLQSAERASVRTVREIPKTT
jgi:hypothetical protein